MPKKFLETEKRKWLELYESGKTEIWIAGERAKCDVRTVKRGIEEARRKQDVVIARRDLVKDALRKHQDGLLEELDKILSALHIPTKDYVALTWQRSGDSILADSETDVSILATVPESGEEAVRRLLKEHLKNDRLWKALAQWRKTYAAHLIARTVLQRKIIAVIQDKTGYKLVESNNIPGPFLYSYTTGDLFFRAVLQHAFGTKKGLDLENDIIANAAGGDVRCGGLVLAEAPGNGEKIRVNLIEAFRELKGSSEAIPVVDTFNALEQAVTKVRQVVEQIKLLGLIPGQCDICRRLGM